jgi:hypothetical protein
MTRAPALFLIAIVFAVGLAWRSQAAERRPDLTLTGTLTGQDHETYREVPFRVPPGVTRLTLTFAYTGREQRAVIDLGLRDPERLRGWSGGNKDRVVIEEADATPSYLPGPIPAGTWKLVLGVPNLRKGAQATYTAKVWFDRAGDPFPGFLPAAVRAGSGWYRGDLHMHTAHSDGSCASRRGVRVPCPTFKTLEAAEAAGLDFVAVSDHNTASHAGSLRELAPYFDDLLVIPAREITTFRGHANVFGPTAPLDFQLGSPRLPTVAKLQDEVARAHGLFSINHPGLPSGESCMGCGWTAMDIDWSRVQAIEVLNGGALRGGAGSAEGPMSGLPFWEARLNAGFRITAVGGSDNHDADKQPAVAREGIGRPTTVVHAAELSQAAVLDAIRQGHAFVDVWGVRDRLLEVEAQAGAARAEMGDALPAAAGTAVEVFAHVAGAPPGAVLSLAGDAAPLARLADPALGGPEARKRFSLTADGKAHWLRVDVRDAKGQLMLIGNPIYLRPAS